jgi:AhpD family alkylhydroperoxidase
LDYQAISPKGAKALGGVYGYLVTAGLPPDLLNLVFLRASQINGCSYCIHLHGHDLLKAGASPDKLLLVSAWREAAGIFSEQERTALLWTETVTLISHTGAPDEDFSQVGKHFDEKQTVDLTIAIALINAYNRLAISFRNKLPERRAAAA